MDQMFLTENHPIRNYFGKGILGKRRKAKQFIIEPISLILREFLVQFTGKSLSSCSISFMDPSTFLKSLYSDLNKKKDTAVFNINYLLKLNLFSFQPNHDLILYLYKRLNQLTILLKFLKDECIKCYSRIRQALLRNTYFVPFAVMY